MLKKAPILLGGVLDDGYLKYALVIAAGYLLGSLSASILISRTALGEDVRSKGSGNAGATNMARVYGLGMGFVTLGGDMLKTILATWLGSASCWGTWVLPSAASAA